MILDSMQVKREILKVAPLEVGQGGLHVGRPVPMMFDFYFYVFLQNKRKCSLDNLALISMFILALRPWNCP